MNRILHWINALKGRGGVALMLLLLMLSCSDFKNSKVRDNSGAEPMASLPSAQEVVEEVSEEEQQPSEAAAVDDDDVPPIDFSLFSIPQGPRSLDRIRINPLGPLVEVFNDSNKYQYAVAEKLGIEPIEDLSLAYFTRRPVVRIEDNQYYTVAELTHSLPYLVPEAARLLKLIGRNFIDSLGRRGADGYRIQVTSLLRTPVLVRKLRRINRNAVDSSTHKFATTFDISYVTFACADTTRTINGEDLKNLLAEVLYDLRKEGRCLVKYERHTPCFHITATK